MYTWKWFQKDDHAYTHTYNHKEKKGRHLSNMIWYYLKDGEAKNTVM